jgi:hypothetical protein
MRHEETETLGYTRTLGFSCEADDSQDYILKNSCFIDTGKLQTSNKISEFRHDALEGFSEDSVLLPFIQ